MAGVALVVGIGIVIASALRPTRATSTEPPVVETATPAAEPTIVTQTPIPAPTRTPSLEPTIDPSVPPLSAALGDAWLRPADQMLMVYVPAGEFEMGSSDNDVDYALGLCNEYHGDCSRDWFEDEQPAHMVELNAFWIDQTEVTVAQFRAFAQATGHSTTAEQERQAWVWVEGEGDWQQVEGADWQHPQGPASRAEEDHPVVQVSWDDAAAYCEWSGARLPTEAEWEYAARGPEGYVYPWGNTFDSERVNYCDANCPTGWNDPGTDDGYAYTAPVGSYPGGQSWCGAHDLAGNVREWMADWHDSNYYARSPGENPAGPASGVSRVVRGGMWGNETSSVRSAGRDRGYVVVDTDGFRCARGSR